MNNPFKGEIKLEPKQLACMDEEQLVEIARPKNESGDLIITVSITRTYLFTELPLAVGDNGLEDETIEAFNASVI